MTQQIDLDKKYQEKRAVFREVLMKLEESDLREAITNTLWMKEDMVDLILDNDYLGDEMDQILLEAGRTDSDGELVRLCGGVKTAKEELELYEKAMGKE